ncbi:hypothetical protein DL93DRAFT_2085356 [Clavulina sp. PMI_390]|nr:hypothetical protein DL93DRAFT_2085356 [Clavulina sp. PMI_390]
MSIETGLGIGIDDQGRWMHPRKIDSSSNLSAKSGDKTSTSPPVSPISPTSPTSSKSSTSPTHTRRPSLSRDPAKNWLTAEPPPTATAPVFARGNRAGGSGTGRGRTAGVVMPVRKEDWIREQRRKSMQAGGVPGGMMSPAERARRQSMIAMGSNSSSSPTSPTNAGAAVPPLPTPPIPARRSSTASPAEAMAATSNLSSRPSPSPTSLSPPTAASMAMARSASSPAAPTQTPASAQIPVPLPTLSKAQIPIARPQAVENTKEKEKKSKNRLSASLSLWRLKSKSSLSLRVDSATLSSASSPPPSPSPSPIRTMSSNPSTNPKLFPAGAVTPMVAAEGPTPISVPPVPALPVLIATPAVPRPQPVTSNLSVDASAEKSARRISGYGEYIHPPQLADTPHSSLQAPKPPAHSVQKESSPEVPLPPPATVISSSSILSTASAASTDSVSSSASDSSSAAGSLFAPTPTTSMSCAGTVSSTPPTSASLSTGGWVSPVTARSVELLKAPSSSRHELGPELEHELEQEVEHPQFGVALSTDELSPMPIPHLGGSHRVNDDIAARDNGMNAHPNDAVVMPTSTLFAVPTPTPTPRPVTGTDMAVSENGAIDLHPRPSHSTKSQSDSRSSSSSRSHSQSRSCVAVSPPLAALTAIVPTPPAPTPNGAPEVEVRSRGSTPTPTPSQPHTQVPNPTARFEVISRVPKAKSDHGRGHGHGHSRSVELTPRNSMGSRSAARSRASLDAATWKSSSGTRRSKGSQESASEFIVLSRRSGEKQDNSQDRDAEGSAASHSSYSTAQSHSQNPSLASSLPAPPTIARPTSPSSTFAALSRALSTPSESAPSRLQKKPTSQKHSHLQASPSRKRSRNHRRSYLTRQNLFASADIPSDEVGMNQNDGEVDHPSPTYGGDDEDEDILTYTNAKGNRVVHEFGVRVPTDTPGASRIPVQASIPTAAPVSVAAIQIPPVAISHPPSNTAALLPMPVPASVPRASPASVAHPVLAGGKEVFPSPGSVLMTMSASAQSRKSTGSGPVVEVRTQASPTSKLKKEKTTSKKGFFGRLSLFATS